MKNPIPKRSFLSVLLLLSGSMLAFGADIKSIPAAWNTADLEWSTDTSPVTFDYLVNFSWFGLNWNDPTAKRVTARTGVSLNFTKPVVDDNQKLNLMIASNNLPDIITLDRNSPSLPLMVKSGMLWSLDELIDKYAPKMRKILPAELLKNYKSPDGKTYQFTTWVQGKDWQKAALENNQMVGTNQSVFTVRKDYYEEVGSPDMSTPEAFIAALAKMKAKHPDKIAFYPGDESMNANSWQHHADMGNVGVQFGLSGDLQEAKGAIHWAARDPKFLAAVTFLSNLYQKGLLTTESFIDTKEVARTKIEKGDVIAYSWAIGEAERVPGDNPNTKFMILKPFKTYQEVRTGAGWLATVVTKKVKDPARAIRFLEYLASVDGHRDVSWGIEGDSYSGDVVAGPHWHLVAGKPVFFPEYIAAKNADWGGVASKNGLGEYWIACNELLWNLPWWDKNNAKMAGHNKTFGPLVVFKPELDIRSPDPTSPEGIIKQKADALLVQTSAKMVFTKDPAGEYRKFIDKLDALGMAKVEAYWTNLYRAKLKS